MASVYGPQIPRHHSAASTSSVSVSHSHSPFRKAYRVQQQQQQQQAQAQAQQQALAQAQSANQQQQQQGPPVPHKSSTSSAQQQQQQQQQSTSSNGHGSSSASQAAATHQHHGSETYYGHEETAKLCARFVAHTFNCPETLPAPAAASSGSSTSHPNIPLTLAHFVAYALHRTRLHPSVTFTALALLHRLKTRFPAARGSSGHRLFLSAFMIASKVVCDDTYSNKSWAVVGQAMFALREINQMEREMCAYLEWQLNVPGDDLRRFEGEVRRIYSRPGPYLHGVQMQLAFGVGGQPLQLALPTSLSNAQQSSASPSPLAIPTPSSAAPSPVHIKQEEGTAGNQQLPTPTDYGAQMPFAQGVKPISAGVPMDTSPVHNGISKPVLPPLNTAITSGAPSYNMISAPVPVRSSSNATEGTYPTPPGTPPPSSSTSSNSSQGDKEASPSPSSTESSVLETPPNSAPGMTTNGYMNRMMNSAGQLVKSYSLPAAHQAHQFAAVNYGSQFGSQQGFLGQQMPIMVNMVTIPPVSQQHGSQHTQVHQMPTRSQSASAIAVPSFAGGASGMSSANASQEDLDLGAMQHQRQGVSVKREPSEEDLNMSMRQGQGEERSRQQQQQQRERMEWNERTMSSSAQQKKDSNSSARTGERSKALRTFTVPCVW